MSPWLQRSNDLVLNSPHIKVIMMTCCIAFCHSSLATCEKWKDAIMFSSLVVAMFNESTEGGVELMIHLFIIILI